jgi:hypothetical protein
MRRNARSACRVVGIPGMNDSHEVISYGRRQTRRKIVRKGSSLQPMLFIPHCFLNYSEINGIPAIAKVRIGMKNKSKADNSKEGFNPIGNNIKTTTTTTEFAHQQCC